MKGTKKSSSSAVDVLTHTPKKIDEGSPFDKLSRLAERIKLGMSRTEVEQILYRSNGGVQGESITIYHELAEANVEVPFDRIGGWGQPDNRVTGPARVFITVP